MVRVRGHHDVLLIISVDMEKLLKIHNLVSFSLLVWRSAPQPECNMQKASSLVSIDDVSYMAPSTLTSGTLFRAAGNFIPAEQLSMLRTIPD